MSEDNRIIHLENGKYSVYIQDGCLTADRYGKDWRTMAGDKLMMAMYHEILRLREQINSKPQQEKK